ncbi:MAG: CBS domain-containing protein [Methanomicrobiales archaeon HGW-Methanomicrobiales-4]|nr:MAG: CBS domain-containing protein [Methanomicrobiales archaeon HGW-Methanomicrobiales-4]
MIHRTMTIYTVCQTNVVSVSPHTTIAFVADLMKEKNIGCVIITEDHKPVGIVTDRDLALRANISKEEKDSAPVSSIMTTDVQIIRKDTGIFQAVQVMKTSRVRRLPVVDMGGRLVGLITVDDILRLLARELGEIARVIGNESPNI